MTTLSRCEAMKGALATAVASVCPVMPEALRPKLTPGAVVWLSRDVKLEYLIFTGGPSTVTFTDPDLALIAEELEQRYTTALVQQLAKSTDRLLTHDR